MSPSPFKTYEEFANATESISSFSQYPMFNYVTVALGFVICIYFIVKSFHIKH